MTRIEVNFILNGKETRISSPANRTLLDVLRDDLGLSGAKDACGGEGECGACTIILDGKPENACLILIGQVEGAAITTIEGLPAGNVFHPLQKAFVESGAVQCGYCTPGAILAAKALLDLDPKPTEQQIRDGLSGNLCRCTGYRKMVDAVQLYIQEGMDD